MGDCNNCAVSFVCNMGISPLAKIAGGHVFRTGGNNNNVIPSTIDCLHPLRQLLCGICRREDDRHSTRHESHRDQGRRL